MKYNIALLIGRFQPFHFGHLYLIKRTLKIAQKIIIGIGSASIYDENNPLDFETRKKIIKAVFYKEKIQNKLLDIIALEDFFNDKKWLDNVIKKISCFDVVVSNNEWTNKIMEDAGFRVQRFPYFRRELYEGWRIRKLIKKGKKWEDRVPNYLISKLFISKKQSTNIFNNIVLGGTFDHFHKGHQALIKKAFEIGKKVLIGITTDNFCQKKPFSQSIESFSIRKKSVSDFLKKNKWFSKAKIISISDFTGGVDKIKNIDAIVVSSVTYLNALKINELREKNKLKPLRIVIAKDVLAEDGKILSSERIRAGEIDKEGRVYLDCFKKTLILPEYLRKELRKPLGKVFKDTKSLLHYINIMEWTMVIAVGDIIVSSLLKEGVKIDIKVIDFKSRKKPIKIRTDPFQKGLKGLSFKNFKNNPGTINFKTAEKLKEIIKNNIKGTVPFRDSPYNWFIIDGEEDLLALPAILFAPLGSLVLYGHWQYGVIGVEVTEKIKEKIRRIIGKFNV